MKVVFCGHPDLAKALLAGHYTKFPKGGTYKVMEFLLGEGLITTNGERWKSHRQVINKGFHVTELKTMANVFNKHVHRLVRKWEELLNSKEESKDKMVDVDMSVDIRSLTFNMICEAGFGYDTVSGASTQRDKLFDKEQICKDFTLLLAELNWRLNDPTRWWRYAHISRYKNATEALNRLNTIVEKIITQRMEKYRVSTPLGEEQDILDILLRASSGAYNEVSDAALDEGTSSSLTEKALKSDVTFSAKDLRDHTVSFLVAGSDTTASSITHVLYELVLHPEIQKKCQMEVDMAFKHLSDEDLPTVTYDCIKDNHFTFLQQVIKETIRLHPPITLLARPCQESSQLGQYLVPADTRIALCLMALHRHPDFWEKPSEFIPERFAPENIRSTIKHPFQYIPFSAGPRNCIGQRLSQVELPLILAILLYKFEFSVTQQQLDNTKFVETLVYSLKDFHCNVHRRR